MLICLEFCMLCALSLSELPFQLQFLDLLLLIRDADADAVAVDVLFRSGNARELRCINRPADNPAILESQNNRRRSFS